MANPYLDNENPYMEIGTIPKTENLLQRAINRAINFAVAGLPSAVSPSVNRPEDALPLLAQFGTDFAMKATPEGRIASLTEEDLRSQIQSATLAMQKRRLILAPGCSVPNDISEESLQKVKALLQKA